MIVPLPSSGDTQIGGHAVLAVGYDDGKQLFKLRKFLGLRMFRIIGYFGIPYAYLTDANLSADFWTLRGMSK